MNRIKSDKEINPSIKNYWIRFQTKRVDLAGSSHGRVEAIGKFFTETNPDVIARYKPIDSKHYDDAIMRQAVEDVRRSRKFSQYFPFMSDCQVFVQDVRKRYEEIFKQGNKK
ncbi:hypothetical protein [Helicobacter cholecystus]|uniref:hypothetical protein n=1 Tax=Helicobacter cholecystus TaxID=45498 RepID=UPI0027397D3B|nr:hypothetical protein [Helicobacter cholecystus]